MLRTIANNLNAALKFMLKTPNWNTETILTWEFLRLRSVHLDRLSSFNIFYCNFHLLYNCTFGDAGLLQCLCIRLIVKVFGIFEVNASNFLHLFFLTLGGLTLCLQWHLITACLGMHHHHLHHFGLFSGPWCTRTVLWNWWRLCQTPLLHRKWSWGDFFLLWAVKGLLVYFYI